MSIFVILKKNLNPNSIIIICKLESNSEHSIYHSWTYLTQISINEFKFVKRLYLPCVEQ